MHSDYLPNTSRFGDPEPWVLQCPPCLPPIPLPILIALGKAGWILSQLSFLLTTHTMRSPGLSHSYFYSHMASFIPFLDPISHPFLEPEALFLCSLELTGSHKQDPLYPWPYVWLLSPYSFSNLPWLFSKIPPLIPSGLSWGGCFSPTFLEP